MQSSSQGLDHRLHFLPTLPSSDYVIVCVFFYVGLGFGGEEVRWKQLVTKS